MTISLFFIYFTDLFLFICCVQRTKKHEWSDFAVKSIILWYIFVLNIHERRIFLKSAGEEIFHPKPVTDKNKNFMTQLVLSEILHCKVYSLSWTFVLNSKWLQGKIF